MRDPGNEVGLLILPASESIIIIRPKHVNDRFRLNCIFIFIGGSKFIYQGIFIRTVRAVLKDCLSFTCAYSTR